MAAEEDVWRMFSYVLILSGVVLAVLEIVLRYEIPYGRYSRPGFGFGVPSRLAWMVQESPAFLIPAWALFTHTGSHLTGEMSVNTVLLLLFALHYFQRAFVYSLAIKNGKPMPFQPFILAFFFCALNGFAQTRSLGNFATYPDSWLVGYNFVSGVVLFFTGMAINIHSDHILHNLRKPGDTGYKIPEGGMFYFVSGANYFGETAEWVGFALACWTLEAAAFAFFTAVFLGGRAITHHSWYLSKFEDYPKHRKAFIPFILTTLPGI